MFSFCPVSSQRCATFLLEENVATYVATRRCYKYACRKVRRKVQREVTWRHPSQGHMGSCRRDAVGKNWAPMGPQRRRASMRKGRRKEARKVRRNVEAVWGTAWMSGWVTASQGCRNVRRNVSSQRLVARMSQGLVATFVATSSSQRYFGVATSFSFSRI